MIRASRMSFQSMFIFFFKLSQIPLARLSVNQRGRLPRGMRFRALCRHAVRQRARRTLIETR